ncbi:MAG: uracil-DNA glycosylase family protein [Myxococcaceae bacterium]
MSTPAKLKALHKELDACRVCPNMIRPVVHGPPVPSELFLVGQAPGPREGGFGRPFAWTAGRTMFRWFQEALGVGEEQFRERVYIAAVARCFPGKANGGGDRRPDADEVARCRTWLEREVAILRPRLVIPVGSLAIEQVTGRKAPLSEMVGVPLTGRYHGLECDIICLPHPSGASTWHRMEPGKTLLGKALGLLAAHPVVKRAFSLEDGPRAAAGRR